MEAFDRIWENIWKVEQNVSLDEIVEKKRITVEYSQVTTDYRVLMMIIGSFILMINIPVVISSGLILKRGHKQKSTYLLLGNISLADMLLGFLLVFSQLAHKFGMNAVCYIAVCLLATCAATSVTCVTFIAIDRYLYIVHGLKYKTWVQPTRVRWTIFGCWIWGLCHGLLSIFGKQNSPQSQTACLYLNLTPPEVILFSTCSGLVFLVTAIVLYVVILRNAIKKVGQLKAMDDRANSEARLRAFKGGSSKSGSSTGSIFVVNLGNNVVEDSSPSIWRAVKVIFFTAGGFTITWLPYYVTSMIYVACDAEKHFEQCSKILHATFYPLTILAMFNCVLNPMIYAWWHKGFRKAIKKIWPKWMLKRLTMF